MKKNLIRIYSGFLLSTIFFLLSSPSSMAYEKEIKDLSAFLSAQITEAGRKTIAVVDFTDLQGNVTELGRFLAEEFSVSFAGAGEGFEVVDRTHLKSIVAEHKLSLTGMIDPKTARKLGQIAGVDTLITGTITPFGDSIRLSVKVLDTETAKVISATTGNIAKTNAIEELLARGIQMARTTGGGLVAMPLAPYAVGKAVEAEGFIFRPVKCVRSGGKVICTISFVNNGKEEREIGICGHDYHGHSYLYDNFGNQHRVSLKIGRQVSGYTEQNFIAQLPINVSFIAEDVRSDATHVTVAIKIFRVKRTIAVRNIPITK
ncbi:MAG: CsgG/HfaB family protein [Desulfobacterales bacterium]|nr:CsgG/HfaB family protein [Desulfobacterales bacterium]